MPEYFISRGASTAVRSGGLGYGSHAAEQGDTIYCEPQQRLQEPKVISNESNRVGSRNLPTFYVNLNSYLNRTKCASITPGLCKMERCIIFG